MTLANLETKSESVLTPNPSSALQTGEILTPVSVPYRVAKSLIGSKKANFHCLNDATIQPDTCGVNALYPRPKGQDFTALSDKKPIFREEDQLINKCYNYK